MIAYLERTLSRTAKTVIAVGGAVSVVVSLALFADGLYVHKTVFTAHERATVKRFDVMDLKSTEREKLSVTAQIFELERQPKLSPPEAAFLNLLKARVASIEAEIVSTRAHLERDTE